MTTSRRPAGDASCRPRRHPKLVVDPAPGSVLHSIVSNLPGPKNETEAQRAARFKLQLAQVLSFDPRDSADAMLAAHCVLLRLVAEDTHRDAARPGLAPATAKKFLRNARAFDRLTEEAKQMLAKRQSRPPGKMDVGMVRAPGFEEVLVPDPDDAAEEAFSAIIVPLHPAPKMLQYPRASRCEATDRGEARRREGSSRPATSAP